MKTCMHRIVYPLLALLPVFAQAQSVSPSLFNGLAWRLIGPFRGGRAVAVSGVPGNGSTFYFGAAGGGIWKTTDAGTVWTPIFDAQSVASIGAIEVAPSNPNVIYAGTGESDIRSDLGSGDGVYKSTDAGKTWSNIGLRDTRQISRIVVDPNDPNVVFVGALGHAYGPSDERGVFRSTNGGETWERVLDRGPNVGAADLAIAPDAPKILFASMWEAHRPPWSTYAPLAGPGSGLYRSTDRGKKWTQLTGHGLPAGEWGRVGVAIARGTRGKRIYAAIEAVGAAGHQATTSGIYRSDDGGDTWALVNADARLTGRAWYFNSITADPNDPEVAYVPNVAFYKLSDGGKSLSIVRGAPGGDDYHQVWIDPANSQHMVLGVDQGTSVSIDGGASWSSWFNQPTAQFYHVITDNDFPYHVYGAQQDSGTAATASRTDHGQIDARDWFTVGGSESGYIAPDPKDPNIFYVSGTYGELSRFDRRTMQSQNIAPWPNSNFGTAMEDRKYRDPWTPVLAFSPVQPNALYLGTQYVMKTLDGGLHWQAISPDLTGASKQRSASDAQTPPSLEDARARGYGVVYTIAPSPLSADEIWAGSDTGLIHLTRDGGKTWSDVTPPGLSAWSKITHIAVSRFACGEAFAAVDRHRLDDMRPYMFRTRDFGKIWTQINEGIGPTSFLNAIREDPVRKGLLFAATEFGVYVSFDDGDRWQSLQLNLPACSVRDLVIHGDDLVVATHGRSFWILDDIAPLRQIDARAAANDARFYKPARAVRITNESFWGTPLQPEEPQASNPPMGAYLDYYLPNASRDAVTFEISDARGNLVRRISSRDPIAKGSADLAIAPRWLTPAPRLSEAPGMHRFVWDLHFAAHDETQMPAFDAEGNPMPVGPLVLPGLYTVKLHSNGQDFTQPLEVVMDPRTRASRQDLIAQYEWTRKAYDDLRRARKATAEIIALEAEMAKAHASDNPTRKQVDAAVRQSAEIMTGRPGQSGLRSVAATLSSVLSALESADRTPPSQVIAAYKDAAAALDARLADWARLKNDAKAPGTEP